MAATIKKIAEAAGVSRGTVDRVLNNRGGVKPDVAEQVRAIAAAMGYSPNRAGKILAARKQPIAIGCFLPSIGNAFFDDVIAGFRKAEAELADFGVSVVIKTVKGYHAEEHIAAIGELLEQGCTALCVCTINIPQIRNYINQIVASGVPVVAVNTDLSKTQRLCYIGPDYLSSGQTAAGMIALCAPAELKLLIVTGSLKIKGHNERIRGFSQTLKNQHLPYKLVDIFESFDNDDYAYETALKIFKEHAEINCVYIAAAGVAGVCRAILEADLPHKLRVLSYDDIQATRALLRSGVIDFTICQEPNEQGYRSVTVLFDYLMGGKRQAPPNHFTNTVIKIKENL